MTDRDKALLSAFEKLLRKSRKEDRDYLHKTISEGRKEDREHLDNLFVKRFEIMKSELKKELSEEIAGHLSKQRSEFYEKIDPILKEVQASREEREISSHRLSEHEDRITKIEDKVGIAASH